MSFADQPAVGAHPAVPASWEGDEWSYGYMEGGAIFKRGSYYYAFGSYGSLGRNYTIRMGRSKSPTGPYVDKDGHELTTFYPPLNRYGASFLLGNDGDQLVPGHPHVWEENGVHYLGYDYRTDLSVPESNAMDVMGIRRLHWVDGWPTIWHPVTVTLDLSASAAAAGQPLEVRLRNVGDEGSVVAVDLVTLETRAE